MYKIDGINNKIPNNKGKNIVQHRCNKLSYVKRGNEALTHINVNIKKINFKPNDAPYNEPSIILNNIEY